jgi:glucose/arabinose dehydrogenase
MAGVRIAFVVSFLALAACADTSSVPFEQQVGPDPVLPPPIHSLIPTVRVAEATGWPPGEMPVAASGWKVAPFATGLDHPRWLCVLPNGDVLVAETNAPERPEEGKGIRGWMTKRVMKKAGAGVPSANRITLLRDADRDGVAEVRSVFLERLNSPFGMVLVGDELYVANTDAVLRFPYRGGETRIEAPGTKVVDLPAGPRNHHWTKNLIASRDGAKLYVTVGSNSNAAENGIEAEEGRAAIWEVDLKTKQHRTFATGLRNPNGLAFEPNTGALWTVVNERDEIGSDLVPDYVTSVKNGAFYGWPYSYYGRHVDDRVKPQRPDLVAKAVKPDYALGSHVAALGLAFSADGAFIGEHGSWNRSPPSGYKVVFVPFANGSPSGPPRDLLSGFLQDDKARGRPVGLALDSTGALLVADDVGNVIWRVTAVAPAVGR